jgi:hypothetical protein
VEVPLSEVGERVGEVWLETAAGDRVALSAHLDSILVVHLLRYYG